MRRFDVHHVTLDPTRGSEIRKRRPCVVVSPDAMNRFIRTVIIAPMTTKGRAYPSRVPVGFDGKDGLIVLDQIRTVDKDRLGGRLGRITEAEGDRVLEVLQEMFAA